MTGVDENVVLNVRAHGAGQASAEVGGFTMAVRNLAAAVHQSNSAAAVHTSTWTSLRNVIKQATVDGGGWRGIMRSIVTDTRTATAVVDGLKSSWSLLGKAATMAGVAMQAALPLAVTGVTAGAGFVGYGMKLAMEREGAQLGLKTWLGSQEKADALIQANRKWADLSPWGLTEANNLAMQGLQAGITDTKKLSEYMNNVGNGLAAVGGSSATLARVSENLTSIQALGKLEAMDFRQFSNVAHINLYDALAKKLGISSQQVAAILASNGGGTKLFNMVGGAEGIAAAIGAAHPNAMTDFGKTLTGRWSTFKDAIKEGVLAGFLPMVPDVTKALEALTPVVAKLSAVFGRGLAKLVVWFQSIDWKPIVNFAQGVAGGAIEGGKSWWGRNAENLSRVGGRLREFAINLAEFWRKVLWPVLLDLFKSLAPVVSLVFLGISKALKFMSDHAKLTQFVLKIIVGMLVGWPIKLVLAVGWLYNHVKLVRVVIQGIVTVLVVIAKVIIGVVKGVGGIVLGFTRAAIEVGKLGWWLAKIVGQYLLEPIFNNALKPLRAIKAIFVWIVDKVKWLADNNPFKDWKIPGFGLVKEVVTAPVSSPKLMEKSDDPLDSETSWRGFWHRLGGLKEWGDTRSPVMFGHSSKFHNNMSARTPGTQLVTSGFRTTMLGNANSDHLRGAYDVIGSGLHSYAALVAQSGGWSQFHGGHLHVVPPVGDTGSPRATSSTGGTTINNYWTVQARTPHDGEQAIMRVVRRMERDRLERAGASL